MGSPGENTKSEIFNQPNQLAEAVTGYMAQKDAIQALWADGGFDHVIFTGCGSTYHLAKTGAALFQSLTGIPSAFYPGSEMVLFPEVVYPEGRKPLMVAISRSGATTETVEAIPVFRKVTGGKVLGITCNSKSPMAEHCDLVLSIDSALEISLAQTRSFDSMLLTAQMFAAHIAGKDLSVFQEVPEITGRIIERYADIGQKIGTDLSITRFFFLGAGYLFGVANEAMLKMKEMSLSYSEAFHTLDFRHGPMSMVDENSLVVGLISESVKKHEVAVMEDMKNLGGQILTISESEEPALAAIGDNLALNSNLPDWARVMLYLPALQIIAYHRSMAKGLNPDKPNNLSMVIELGPLA